MSIENSKLVFALAAALLGGGVIGYWIARPDEPHIGQPPSMQQERKVLYWHDPMVPNARFDKPGKSPFMDMDLVPVYADEEGSAAVRIEAAMRQNLGIRLGKVEKTVVQPKLAAVGSVAFDEHRLEVVQARVEGYVTRLHVRAPLERVRRGQPLVDIVAPAWLEAQEEYLALLDARSSRALAIREAARQRLVVLGVPETAIRALEQDRKTNAFTTFVSPIDGVVTELAVRAGAAFMPGAVLFRVNGLQTVWVNAQVPEAQVAIIPAGASVEARATAWPGETFRGRVEALLPDVDPQTRTLAVRAVIDNHEQRLAPGMFVTLELAGQGGDAQLTVPSEAVIMTGERNVVVVARENGGFDIAQVTLGAEAGGRTAILSGLDEGQSVVISGQFLIDSEASLKSAASRLSSEDAPTEPRP